MLLRPVRSCLRSCSRAFSSSACLYSKLTRDYNAAVAALNTLQSNFAIVDKIRKSGKTLNEQSIPEMLEWCDRVGYKPSDLNRLNLIHVAGTKGKGSTSAFLSSIMQQYATRQPRDPKAPTKTGLYTSPHLRFVRERIRINDAPISEELFARYFFEVWDCLEQAVKERGPLMGAHGPSEKPVYFRYLTLMMFHAYLSEGVDTAIIECGIGGEYDCTNIIEKPTVSAVTSLGIDHVALLGGTVEEIAWHKAGVFKKDARSREVFTVDGQPGKATEVLRQRAEDRGLSLVEVSQHPQIADGTIKLGLGADFQKTNASMAVAIAAAHLQALGMSGIPEPTTNGELPTEFIKGLTNVRWGGRCETRKEDGITWYIDGGHTMESIKLAADWFAKSVAERSAGSQARKQRRVLFFNQQQRDAAALARELHSSIAGILRSDLAFDKSQPLFQDAIFSTNVTYAPRGNNAGQYKADLVSINTSADDVTKLVVQKALAEVWPTIDQGSQAGVEGSIEEAIDAIRAISNAHPDEDLAVFVTGSLHLVGGVLEVLESSTQSAS